MATPLRRRAAVSLLGLLGLLGLTMGLAACAERPEAPPPPEHLVLVTVDTWRGDHLLAARGGADLTPGLARRRQRLARFTDHSSAGTETAPGVASIMTGLLPRRSGVLRNTHGLQVHLPSLPALLAARGFSGAAFVANPVLRRGSGFERGFASYAVVAPRPPAHKARGGAVVDAGLRWLDERRGAAGGRLFLWLHLMEPHGPYQPEEWARARLSLAAFGAERRLPVLPGHDGWQGLPAYQAVGAAAGDTGDVRDYELRYAAEVLAADHALDRLLAGLERRGILDRALVVVTADHGEALAGDHGFYFSHGHGLTQDQLHVPLLLLAPGLAAGERTYPTSSVDLLPTLLRLLGVDGEALELDGGDLFAEPRPVLAETGFERMVREGPWKLRWRRDGGPALFHLGRDPGERADLSARRAERAARLRQALREARRPPLAQPQRSGALAREAEAQLRALGYL